MIGIVLAGGTGTRLYPITKSVSKQLLPVYDKPMIHYPIATLMHAGIRDILLITTSQDQSSFKRLLGDGSQLGIRFRYLIQAEPKGLVEAFTIAEKYIRGKKTSLILGDNIFHGTSLGKELRRYEKVEGAQIFGYRVKDPSQYGVAEINKNGEIVSIVEKPSALGSNIAIPGLYFYDESVIEKSKLVKPSKRGELEISSLNQLYLEDGSLNLKILPRGTAWLDTGEFETLYEAGSFVRVLQERQGYKIACLEEIAFRNGWIDYLQLENIMHRCLNLDHKSYLSQILSEL